LNALVALTARQNANVLRQYVAGANARNRMTDAHSTLQHNRLPMNIDLLLRKFKATEKQKLMMKVQTSALVLDRTIPGSSNCNLRNEINVQIKRGQV